MVRSDWTLDQIKQIYQMPLLDLLFKAQEIHRQFHPHSEVQLCSLLSIKTGACSEDCGYCPQSAHYKTDVTAEKLMEVDSVLAQAKCAKENGATRFCMGAAWREVKEGNSFDQVLEMVRGVKKLGMEACVTLGMLTEKQAQKLKEAGLTAYNHNLDTSREYYDKIITTRTYDDRLQTLKHVRQAGITVCSGGIIGMGESVDDRCSLLQTLAAQNPHPESVPINTLVAVKGTPLENQEPISSVELIRMIATARILMPQSRVRLSAGRTDLTKEAQILCYLAGANSIFYGEKLLTTPNPEGNADLALFHEIGIKTKFLTEEGIEPPTRGL